ncbi:hypothetical protein LTR37_006385 [Vermiconidia calcicola]|uniref:Uncharacterized protein n=1 Tax=Vermiconidia calcicola TaxID=1690605 RepID=A0ACC3NGN6_9PEZI|nr:hypothetical protein LTR37_006385 [Vermiconidia calcicola]
MSKKPKPTLPNGGTSIFSGLSENLSFHSSPESFITGRILQYHKEHPEDVDRRVAVRAKILNRNVVILSSYRHIKQVLDAGDNDEKPAFVAAAPYRRLMAEFFPSPNLLLEDGCPHRSMRTSWTEYARHLTSESVERNLVHLTSQFLDTLPLNVPIDLYTTLKDLAWQLFLSTFLELENDNPIYDEYKSLQEDLLRGQFSLFPVSVNTGFWHSPRKAGISARKKLQSIIAQHLKSRTPSWLCDVPEEERSKEEVMNHLLMATSSLAVKGFASLLMPFLLNVFLSPTGLGSEKEGLIDWIQAGESEARAESVLAETMRLSPPIVGVMRRATGQKVLSSQADREPDTLVPEGWDVWSYLPGSNRDPAVYGKDPDIFHADRYLDDAKRPPAPIVFGMGAKNCLGASFAKQAALAVLGAFQQRKLGLRGDIDAPGVRAWLGWQTASPQQWAQDMKQLPTQRPAKTVHVCLRRR